MLSAGRPHQLARHIWTAFGRIGHVDSVAFTFRELCLFSCGAANDSSAVYAGDASVSRSQEASCSGRSEPAEYHRWHGVCYGHRGIYSAAVPACLPGRNDASLAGFTGTVRRSSSLHRAGVLRSTTAWTWPLALPQLPDGGPRAFHSWYYGSKLRNRAITSIFDLDQLADTLRSDGDKLDHVNLTVFLKQLQRVAAHAATKTASQAPMETGSAGTGSTAVSKAVAAAASRAVEEQVELLAAAAIKRVRKRSKWYDPRNAAAVVFSTASLGYTDGRVLHDLTSKIMARLNEAYSRDLLLLLRGLDRHAKLSAGGPAISASGSSSAATVALAPGAVEAHAQKPWGSRRFRSMPYSGPPAELLEGVERFMVAKIPTGRMPPENVEGILHCLRQLSPGRPVDRMVLTTVEDDLRHRLAIYAPKPLAGLLAALAAEGHPLPLDMLDAAAGQFARHADAYGSGAAAARFLTAAAVLLRSSIRTMGGDGNAATETTSSNGTPGPAEWISARPDVLAQCLTLMSKDVSRADAERLVSWLAALSRAEVPLALLAAAGSSGPATAGAGGAAAAAAAFVRAHGAAVEVALPRLSPDQLARLRKAYDNTGLQYPKGL